MALGMEAYAFIENSAFILAGFLAVMEAFRVSRNPTHQRLEFKPTGMSLASHHGKKTERKLPHVQQPDRKVPTVSMLCTERPCK